METLATTDEKDREVTLQFSFSNIAAIPQFLENLQEETESTAKTRKHSNASEYGTDLTDGGQFRGKKIDLRNLVSGLLKSEYELVGAWKQKRIKTTKGWGNNKPYWMIRFRFRHKKYIDEYKKYLGKTAWQDMVEKRPMILGELVTICELAFWQLRAWRNPWYQDNELLPGAHFISINFEGRQPLYDWEPPKEAGYYDIPAQFKPDAVFNIY